MRIVYVEDNIANVHLVKRVARMGKHEIINYIDGMDALNNFSNDNPDLVLMDIQLAGELTGIEVVKKLRDKGFDTPIYAVTAYAMVGDRERCIEAGCTGYISKPIPIPELVQLFSQYDKPKASPEVANKPSVASASPSTEATPTATMDDLTQTKTLLSAASIKPNESKENATPSQKPDSATPVKPDASKEDLTETKTLLSAASIKSDVPKEDATETKSSKVTLDTLTKTEENPTEEKVTTVAEFDNDDTISVNKDKPAHMK